MKKYSRNLGLVLAAAALAFPHRPAFAVANGDGVCSAAEAANFDCATFGTNVLEFLGAFGSNRCPLDDGTLASCTTYYYRYTGSATNQLDAAIPGRLVKALNTATETHCQQLYSGGTGDPTTNFGKNQNTLAVCRTASNLVTAPDVSPPLGANLAFAVDPSSYDRKNPLDFQLKQGSSVYGASIAGPYLSQAEVQESAVTLTTPTGQTVSYTNAGGTLQITGGTGRLVAPGGTKLCVVKPGGDPTVPYTSASFAANWDCGTITYATEQCDIKTDNHDPCRYIGGTCVLY